MHTTWITTMTRRAKVIALLDGRNNGNTIHAMDPKLMMVSGMNTMECWGIKNFTTVQIVKQNDPIQQARKKGLNCN